MMKALVICVLFVAVTVYAENCNSTANCFNTVCTPLSTYKVTCLNHGIGTQHTCTCVLNVDNISCSGKHDCDHLNQASPCEHHGYVWECHSDLCRCHNND